MRQLFSSESSLISRYKWIQSADIDEAFWRGATLLMLVAVTVILAVVAR